MKIRRKVLPVMIIVLTDEGLCRMANWSPISFADMPTSNEYRRWGIGPLDLRPVDLLLRRPTTARPTPIRPTPSRPTAS